MIPRFLAVAMSAAAQPAATAAQSVDAAGCWEGRPGEGRTLRRAVLEIGGAPDAPVVLDAIGE